MTTDWAGQADMMKESMGYLLSALLLAVIIVYLVLAAQFESFLHPFTIMLSLPLSMVGALGAIALTHSMLNIMTMIGIILLMGLVTKNAILLVDYANTLRRQGIARKDAFLKAGAVRLRPILMTTGAMIFGMAPVALGLSEGGELRAPMAIAVIGGLITSTMLTWSSCRSPTPSSTPSPSEPSATPRSCAKAKRRRSKPPPSTGRIPLSSSQAVAQVVFLDAHVFRGQGAMLIGRGGRKGAPPSLARPAPDCAAESRSAA
jgi:predicted RND superfamily exporter protein